MSRRKLLTILGEREYYSYSALNFGLLQMKIVQNYKSNNGVISSSNNEITSNRNRNLQLIFV